MKKISVIILFIVLAFRSFSQDYMVLKNGEKIAVTILTNADEYVRYRLFNDRTRKMYVKDKSKIEKLIFQDGTVETDSETTIQDSREKTDPSNDNNDQKPSQTGDFLFLKNGRIDQVTVLEITPEIVKYKPFENHAPIYSVYKSDVIKIVFQNGKVETFAETEIRNSNNQPLENQKKSEYRYPSADRDSKRNAPYPVQDNYESLKITSPKRSRVQFGIKGGVNLSTFSGLNETIDLINERTGWDMKAENKTAFHAGFMCRINLTQNRLFFLQTELLFSLQGDKGKKGETSFADDLYYLQLPAYLGCKMTITPGWDLILGAGLYAAYGVYGSENTFDKGFDQLDYGFSFMGGFQFGKIQITGAYDLGKNEVFDGKSWGEAIPGMDTPPLYSRNLKISLGYFF